MVSTMALANRRLGRKRYLFMVVVYRANLTDRLQKGNCSKGSFANHVQMLNVCARDRARTDDLLFMRELLLPLSYPGVILDSVFYYIYVSIDFIV